MVVLSYPSSKSVLSHMDANLRILLSLCYPSLRTAERSVSLKCRRIYFGQSTEIENVTYRVDMFHGDEGSDHHVESHGPRHHDQDVVLPGGVEHVTRMTIDYGSCKQILRIKHTSSIHTPQEYINTILFGKRIVPIQTLYIGIAQATPVLRFPPGVSFQTKDLETMKDSPEHLVELGKILDASSCPLDILVIHHREGRLELESQDFVRGAEQLLISNYAGGENVFDMLLSMPNKEVEVYFITNDTVRRSLPIIIESWIRNEREIGTCYKLRCLPVKPKFNFLKRRFATQTVDDSSFIIPLNTHSNIMISRGDEDSNLGRNLIDLYFLTIEVVALVHITD